MWHSVLMFWVMTFIAAPAFSQTTGAAPYSHAQTGIAFPQTLGPLKYAGFHDYKDQGRPDLGVAARYVLPDTPVRADVYLYDMNRPNLGTGLASPDVRLIFEAAMQDIVAMEKQGIYAAVRKIEEGKRALSTPGGSLPVLWAHFTFDRLPGPNVTYTGPLISDLYVTAYKNFFLKIRFTSPAGRKEQHPKDLNRFLTDLGKLLK